MIVKNKRYGDYSLSYSIRENGKEVFLLPQNLLPEEMLMYIDNNYRYKEKIDMLKLQNDLILFRTYKTDLELNMKDQETQQSMMKEFMSIFINIMATTGVVTSFGFTISSSILILLNFVMIFEMTILYTFSLNRRKDSPVNRLKTVNNVIYTLEAIGDYNKFKFEEFSDTKREYSHERFLNNQNEDKKINTYFIEVNEMEE